MCMIKILHSGDWHLDSPMQMDSRDKTRLLRDSLARIPAKIAAICKAEQCDMMLLSGDLFDGTPGAATVAALQNILADVAVPVFITPGNHDFAAADSLWLRGDWPENVHIFTKPVIGSVAVEALNCRIYGAGFTAMDCPGLLEGFTAEQTEKYAIGIFHGDPTQVSSPYCPITTAQVKASELDYLALGHIHKGDAFRAGKTLCAWPGCPMGRGYDEEGEKGVLIVTVDDTVSARFVPLDTPRFYDMEIPGEQPLSSVLPPVGNDDFYRITFTGPSDPLDLPALQAEFARFPNLVLRDRTTPPVDLWGSAGADTFEGMYFGLLKEAMEGAGEEEQATVRLAAKISRQLLDGQEVVLP